MRLFWASASDTAGAVARRNLGGGQSQGNERKHTDHLLAYCPVRELLVVCSADIDDRVHYAAPHRDYIAVPLHFSEDSLQREIDGELIVVLSGN